MKRCLITAALVFGLMTPLMVWAQENEHVEVGVFANYFRLSRSHASDVNFTGVGGRIGFNVNPYTQLEAEMAYDFSRAYTPSCDECGGVGFARSNTRVLHGLFGPKFQAGLGGFKVFATGKVGIISFDTTNQGVGSGFEGSLGAVGNGNAKLAVYPGGGIEGFLGPVGIRLEAGDEIYFDNGARNNLRVTVGPTFRF